ncbi:MAG TPA: FmdB family zinc ribbon protein [Pyrinomonadaceae bacterium]|jgi:putative FmdB family regulatory protein|nr:FmdB family zinc ribbon protein [Pyrinomonadaceae bacterium]
MPIYEYKCKKCNAYFEKIQSFSDPVLTVCEKCSGELEKLISLSGFAFKGNGWYITDYARKQNGSNGANGTKAKSEAASAKSDSTSGANGASNPKDA